MDASHDLRKQVVFPRLSKKGCVADSADGIICKVTVTKVREKVYAYLRRIPRGKVVTYGQIAVYLGNKKLARHVGNLIHDNPDPIGTPCYKVVSSQGKLAFMYGDGGIEVQRQRLEQEEIEVRGYTVDLQKYQWKETEIKGS